MKRLLLSVLIASACSMTYAAQGGEGNNTNCNGQGNPNSPCTGNGGTTPGGDNVSTSRAEARAKATAIALSRSQANATGGNARATGGNSTATGTGGAGGNAKAVSAPSSAILDVSGAKFGGDVVYPKQVPPAYAPSTSQPPTSCRLTMGAGGSDDRVSMSFGFPIGNDAVCLHKKKDSLMRDANVRKPGTFSDDDFLRNDCTVEGMDQTKACKELAKR